MVPTSEHLEAFAPLQWATPYLTSPDWEVREYARGNDPSTNKFGRLAMRANDGVSHWLELYLKPAPGEEVKRTVSLIKFGTGITGQPGIAHGGATMTMMDDGLACPMISNELVGHGDNLTKLQKEMWEMIEQGKSVVKALEGYYVTAKLDVKFLRPVPVPGVVGIETEMLESTGKKMKMRGVMKDAKGTPLMQGDAVYVKLGGGAKL
jgi:acyl-coenzyme A thioesterase PaaI-like protein